MAGTIPSATAWRAKSGLVQWVMCRPLAIGSRQASRTISARCRGGNPGRPPGSVWWCQEAGQSRVLVEATNPPNRRAVALSAEGQLMDRFPGGDAQDDLCPLDLIPGEGLTAGDLLQDRGIVGSNLQNQRFSTTHGTTPVAEVRCGIQHTGCPEFVALLAARDTRPSIKSVPNKVAHPPPKELRHPPRFSAGPPFRLV